MAEDLLKAFVAFRLIELAGIAVMMLGCLILWGLLSLWLWWDERREAKKQGRKA